MGELIDRKLNYTKRSKGVRKFLEEIGRRKAIYIALSFLSHYLKAWIQRNRLNYFIFNANKDPYFKCIDLFRLLRTH